MDILTALNIGLAALRLGAVSSVSINDPDVAEWQKHFENAKREVLSFGWQFNTDTLTLSPSAGKINIPSGYLRVPAIHDSGLAVRNGAVWDPAKAAFYTTPIVNAQVIVDVAWTDIPHEFQTWIAYKAAAMFVHQVKGAVNDYVVYRDLERMYMSQAERLYRSDFGKGTGSNAIQAEYRR